MDNTTLLPARLKVVRSCPARSDFVELIFETESGEWTWCFREVADEARASAGSLVFKLGRYGAQAHPIEDDNLGFAMPTEEALSMILGGATTYVTRELVERG